jgi:hypothetical protein
VFLQGRTQSQKRRLLSRHESSLRIDHCGTFGLKAIDGTLPASQTEKEIDYARCIP